MLLHGKYKYMLEREQIILVIIALPVKYQR